MKKSKGFTLVELLAVIVILAVLVLFATPAVTSIMQGSQQKAFKNEVLELVKNVQTAYSTEIINGAKSVSNSTNYKQGGVIYNLPKDKVGKNRGTGTKASKKYLCMGLQDLVDKQYVTKNFKQYGGYIQLWIDESGASEVYVNVYNGSYYMQGYLDTVSKPDYLPSQDSFKDKNSSVAGQNVPTDKPAGGNYDCPTDPMMPTLDATNGTV